MFKPLLAAGAATLALTTPAAADPGKGRGHGQGNHAHHGPMAYHGPTKQQDKHASRIYQARARANYWGTASCPPGLAKKNNGCLPPGIAKRSFNVGDRWNGNYSQWGFNQIPLDWRNQYGLDSGNRYYYRNGYLYGVDPQTRLVESVIQALIR